jgi:hypothetical protein
LIDRILETTNEAWQLFLSSRSKATIFHHPAWSNLIANCYGYRPFIVAAYGSGGEIKAGLPMIEISQPFSSRRWVSLPFTDHCAPLHVDQDSLRDLLENINQASRERGVSSIELRWNLSSEDALLANPYYVLHTIPLSPDFHVVQSRFQAMHRRNSIVAQKRGVRIICGNDIDDLKDFYKLHLQTRRRQGIPVQPFHFFELMWKHLFELDLGFVMKAYQNTTCLAAAVFLKYNQTITYKYGASLKEGLDLRPNDLLFSTVIQWACENGFTLFDMGRTDKDNPGLSRFKKGWGAEEIPLKYYNIPQKRTPPIPSNYMKIMKPIIQKSPKWVCQFTGELFYKYIG